MADQQPDHQQHTKRDSETFIALGSFMSILSVTVLIGTLFAERFDGMVVNAICGVVLLSISAGFIVRGFWIRRGL